MPLPSALDVAAASGTATSSVEGKHIFDFENTYLFLRKAHLIFVKHTFDFLQTQVTQATQQRKYPRVLCRQALEVNTHLILKTHICFYEKHI